MACSASSREAAVSTSYPSFSRKISRNCRRLCSSSTTRMYSFMSGSFAGRDSPGPGKGFFRLLPLAPLAQTDDLRPPAFSDLLRHRGVAADRARALHGPAPRGEPAFRVAGAAVEHFPRPGGSLHHLSLAALGTSHPGPVREAVAALGVAGTGDVPGSLPAAYDHRFAALVARNARLLGGGQLDASPGSLLEVRRVSAPGVIPACEELPLPPEPDHHLPAARRAGDPRGDELFLELGHRALRALELLRERPVEIVERPGHLAPPLLDLVELLLHPGGEGDIHHVRKGFLEELRDDPAEFRGEKLPVLHPDVSAVPDRLDDRGVRGRPPDPLLLQLLDEGAFGKPGGGLGEVLRIHEFPEREGFPLGKVGQDVSLRLLLVLFLLLLPGRTGTLPVSLLVQFEIPEEPRDRPGRPEQGAGGRRGGRLAEDIDRGLLELRGRHLGGDEPVPDQLVQ